MKPILQIPKFEDSKFLTESELYRLAWLTITLHQLNNVAEGQLGFCWRIRDRTGTENSIQVVGETLSVKDLFVISEEGIPFVFSGEQILSLPPEKTGISRLYAKAFIAKSSQAFKKAPFETNVGKPPTNEGGTTSLNGYRVILGWETEGNSVNEDVAQFDLELGILDQSETTSFAITPVAYAPLALPPLLDAVDRFADTLDSYTHLLLDSHTALIVDSSHLFEKLDQVQHNCRHRVSSAQDLIGYVQSLAEAAKGFYLRLAYSQDRLNPLYRECQGLEGRILEYKLSSLKSIEPENFRLIIAELALMSSIVPKTGHEQIRFFHKLTMLFSQDYTKEIFQARTQFGQHSNYVTPPIQNPLQQSKRDPKTDIPKNPQEQKKRIIPLIKKRS